MDMIFYWFKDRVEQDQFNVGWTPGDTNMGDLSYILLRITNA
jgi:hypothetical protein